MQPRHVCAPGGPVEGLETLVSVFRAVQRDLRAIRRTAPDVAASALAASAKVLAQQLDDPETSATSKSMCARALREAMDALRAQAPPQEESDRLDDLTTRRARRRAAS